MRVFQFTEQPYPDVWDDHNGSLRVNLPNRKLDPKRAADLLLGAGLTLALTLAWELVDMTAHWQWEERNHGLAYVTFPSQVVGYALTFKRPKE